MTIALKWLTTNPPTVIFNSSAQNVEKDTCIQLKCSGLDVLRERLGGVFAEVITVDVLDSQDAAHLALLQRPELGITFTKIHCWNLTQYEKCVFLDADTLVSFFGTCRRQICLL